MVLSTRLLTTGARAAGLLPAQTRGRLADAGRRALGRKAQRLQDWPELSSQIQAAEPSSRSAGNPNERGRVMSNGLPCFEDRPRCLVATPALDTGGVDEVAALLARRLPALGFITAVLHTRDPSRSSVDHGRLRSVLEAQGILVVDSTEAAGAKFISDWRPDVVSGHGAADWVIDAASAVNAPYVETLHGMHTFFNADWSKEVERARRIHTFVAVSELVKSQYLHGNPGFPAARAVVIPNGVDAERRQVGDRTLARNALELRSEFLFVSLSRYSSQKNTFALVAAFEEVAGMRPQARLAIAGRPDDSYYLLRVQSLLRNLRCRDKVQLRDHLSLPGSLLAASDAFVLDSYFEGWSLASMEALHAGVPVVVTDVGGAREQVGTAGRGILVPNPLGDPSTVDWGSIGRTRFKAQENRERLVEAMVRMIDERELWFGLRDSLAEESRQRFSLDRMLAAHATVLRAAALS